MKTLYYLQIMIYELVETKIGKVFDGIKETIIRLSTSNTSENNAER